MGLSLSAPQSALLIKIPPFMSLARNSVRQLKHSSLPLLRPLLQQNQQFKQLCNPTSTSAFSQQSSRPAAAKTSNALPSSPTRLFLNSTLNQSASKRHLTILSTPNSKSTMSHSLYADDTPEPVKNATGLHLITQSTPNGQKVQIFLEELKEIYKDLEWTYNIINIGTNEQKKDWFLRLNPNGRIPVLIDNKAATPDGAPFPVMETSAELLYLLNKYDKDNVFGFSDELEKNQLLQWLFFWHGSGAPYQGQVNHFAKFAKEKVPYAIERFKNETLRVYGVIEIHLSGKYTGQPREYLAGNGVGKYSVADIGTWPWINIWKFSGAFTDEDMEAFPHLLKWIDRIKERPAVQRGTGDNYNAQKRPDLYVGEK